MSTVVPGTHAVHFGPRDRGLAVLLAVAATILLGLELVAGGRYGPHLPGSGDPVQMAQSMHLLRLLVLLEAGFLGALAALVALRSDWLRRAGGLVLLERHARSVLALLVLLHVGSLLFYFPAHALLGPDPAVSCDNAYHYYQVFVGHELLSRGHSLWGYDPYFMAGYPAGVIFDLDMKGAEIYCHLLAPIGLAYAYKSYIVLSFVLFPLVMYGAARLLGLRRLEALIAVGIGLLYWHWGRPLVGHFRWAGMHSYLLASYLAVLAIALFYRSFALPPSRMRALAYAGAALLVAATCQIHPLAALLLAPGFLALYIGGFRRLQRGDHLLLALGLLFVLEANADWIVPFLRFRHYKTASNYWFQFQGLKDIVFVYSRKTSLFFTAITIFGVVGTVMLRRRSGLAALTVGASAATYFLAAFYGARLSPLANTEPGRYLVPFAFLLCLPAALALVPLLRRAQRSAGPAAVVVGLVCAASLTPFLSLAENRFFDVHAVGAQVDPRFVELMGFLQRTTTPAGRILFETPGGFYNSSDLFYGGHLQALVPIYTHREVIGGPYPVNFLVHATVDFKNGALLDRALPDWEPKELERFLANYNVGWVVCWSGTARRCMDALPELTPAGDFDRFRVYTVRQPAGFLLQGSGKVTADYNEIAVTEAVGDTLILKYHWLESLRTTPPLPLDSYPMPGDPVGFIRVRTLGARQFVIRNES